MEKYEVKGVTQANEIKKAYDTAIAQNNKYYRTISNTGKIYGWVGGKHCIADNNNAVFIDGEYWFENEHYVEPVVEVEEKVEETDELFGDTYYKELYEEEVEKNEALLKETNELVAELDLVKKEFANYKAVVEAFKKL